MMTSDNDISRKVDAAMRSLDQVGRADAPPFLFTRIQAALRAETPSNSWERILHFISKPSVAFASLLLIVVLNGSILAWNASENGETMASENREEFADEYNLAVVTFYDYESK